MTRPGKVGTNNVKGFATMLLGASSLLAPSHPVPLPPIPAIQMPVEELILEAAVTEGVRPKFALDIAWRESKYHPEVVSREGAMGVFQLMPETVVALGVRDPFDPIENVQAAVHYLKVLLRRYGSETLADCVFSFGPASCQP